MKQEHYEHLVRQLHTVIHQADSIKRTAQEALVGSVSDLPTDVSPQTAQIIAEYVNGRFSSQQPEFQFMGSMSGRFEGKKPVMREINYSELEMRVLAGMLKQSGLDEWFDSLRKVVSELEPNSDLLTFKRRVEELLDDKRVRTFRA